MTRVGLTEKEEKQLLFLLEGDISDVDIAGDDELLDDEILDNLQDYDKTNDNLILLDGNVSIEVEQGESDFESDDEIPLATLFLPKMKKKNKDFTPPKWRKRDIDQVNSDCNVSFSEPDNILTPLEYFRMFFDDNIIQNLVEQTNLYSMQKHGVSVNTTYTEMCNYLGIHVMSGIVYMPSYRMYWAQETRYSTIADVMSRNRFEKIRSNLHINDNTNMKSRDQPDYDKLFKVRPFIDAVKENFKKLEPEEHNSIDEIMIPFKGHSSLKQYIKSKPHKWGIKVFARAGVSGIVYEFDIYIGKGTVVTETSSLGFSGDIVVKLATNLPKNQNFKIYTDNFFTSYKLFTTLKNMGIHSIGTVRRNRLKGYEPKDDKVLKKDGRGSLDYRTDTLNNIVAVTWFDNKSVTMISTYKGVEPTEMVRRWSQTDKAYIQITRPEVIKTYNTNMGGVDLNDMLVSLYRTRMGTKRYYFRIFFHLMDISIVNAWLLYRRHCKIKNIPTYKKLIVFRSEIGRALIECLNVKVKRGRAPSREATPPVQPYKKRSFVPKPIDDIRYNGIEHWPVHIEPKMRCRQCKSYTRMACEKCKMSLCVTKDRNCFVTFHKK